MSQPASLLKKQDDLQQAPPLAKDGLKHDHIAPADIKRIHRSFYPKLLKYASVLVRNEQVADDILLDVFVAAWRDVHFPARETEIEVRLFKLVRMACVSFLLNSGMSDFEELLFDQPVIRFERRDLDGDDPDGDDFETQRSLLNLLSPVDREITYLQNCFGFNLYEISLITGKSYALILANNC